TPGMAELRLDALNFRKLRTTVAGAVVTPRMLDSGFALPLAQATGDTLVATVEWEVAPADGLIIRGVRDSWTAFADHWPNRARHWLPVVDHPSDKASVSWTVRVPPGFRVIANGIPLSADTTGEAVTWRFRHAQPIPTYLMVIGAGRLDEVDLGSTACGDARNGGCVAQSVLVQPALRGTMPGTFAQAGPIVHFFASLLGPFPYDRLAHVQSLTRFGGMENAGAIFYAWNIFQSGKPFPVGLIAHETAHQWFGDNVTERAWAHAWLSEGFATYLAAMYTEHAQGDSAFHAELREMRRAVMASAVSRTRPVLDTAQTVLLELLNTNSYQKGGLVLHMLRREIGDSAFVRAMRRYQLTFRDGNALTRDFQAACEAESGQSLGWFFDQWLTRPGWPEIALWWRMEGTTALVTVTQPGKGTPYRVGLPVELTFADGSREFRVLQVPASGGASFRLALAPGQLVRSLRPDPRGDLLAAITLLAAPQ
ncbi:MAG: M1 family metallopeptidase, partial [Gemmatimonadetes bacterium]|nr:M1 family metallopeptidase [Gemmatimonadota bacterium]